MNPIEQHAEPGEEGYLRRRELVAMVVVLTWMSLASLVVTAIQILTLFQARNFCQNVIATWCARRILSAFGVDVALRDAGLLRTEEQTVFVGNHTSTLDFFVVTALGLPNARAFLARKNVLFLPVGVLSVMLGHFLTVPQKYPERRRTIFKRACERLRISGDSVFVTPEGTRHTNGVGPFNRGAFHLALELGAPIQPLFVDVPSEINPGKGLKNRPGTVTVRAYPPISTEEWELETLREHIAEVRQCFLDYPEGWTDQP